MKIQEIYKKISWIHKSVFAFIILVLVFFVSFRLWKFPFSATKEYDCGKYPKPENAVVIRKENNQFNPNELTVNVCDTLLFLNLDPDPTWPSVQPASAYKGLDAGRGLEKFDYFQFQVTKTGKYSFYDHLHEQVTGKITINEIK